MVRPVLWVVSKMFNGVQSDPPDRQYQSMYHVLTEHTVVNRQNHHILLYYAFLTCVQIPKYINTFNSPEGCFLLNIVFALQRNILGFVKCQICQSQPEDSSFHNGKPLSELRRSHSLIKAFVLVIAYYLLPYHTSNFI